MRRGNDNDLIKLLSNSCRAAYHLLCDYCRCVCHIELEELPPETTTPLPPQLGFLYNRDLGWPA